MPANTWIAWRRNRPSRHLRRSTTCRAFDEPLPEASTAADSILRMLHEFGSPATTAIGGGRYFGFVNGGALPIGLAARLLADVWDQNAALHIMSPIASKLEQICENWLVELFDLPAGTAAGLVSGTSTATLCGALAARDALLRRRGWNVSATRIVRRSADPRCNERRSARQRGQSAGHRRHRRGADRARCG